MNTNHIRIVNNTVCIHSIYFLQTDTLIGKTLPLDIEPYFKIFKKRKTLCFFFAIYKYKFLRLE